MPFNEEEQIKDKQNQYKYKIAKYKYLTSMDNINKLENRMKVENEQNERFIDAYAKRNIPSPR